MPSTSKLIVTVTAGLALLLGTACGGDDKNENTTGFSTGIDPSRPASSLSAAETQQFCKAFDGLLEDPAIKGSLCQVVSVIAASLLAGNGTDAQLQMACTQGYNECLKDDGKAEPGSSSKCEKPAASCTATIGEIEQCFSDMKLAFVNLGKSLPACSALTKASINQSSPASAEPTMPASCTALEKKCPDVEVPGVK